MEGVQEHMNILSLCVYAITKEEIAKQKKMQPKLWRQTMAHEEWEKRRLVLKEIQGVHGCIP